MDSIVEILLSEVTRWIPKVVGAVVFFLVFLVLTRIVKGLITRSAQRLGLDGQLTSLLVRISKITLIIFGLITALGTLGLNVSALVAGLGLTGFALGFAMKDTISNLLSGVLILVYRPFKMGERIMISGFEGVVVSIDLRYTELEYEGKKILIPNSKLFTTPITILK